VESKYQVTQPRRQVIAHVATQDSPQPFADLVANRARVDCFDL